MLARVYGSHLRPLCGATVKKNKQTTNKQIYLRRHFLLRCQWWKPFKKQDSVTLSEQTGALRTRFVWVLLRIGRFLTLFPCQIQLLAVYCRAPCAHMCRRVDYFSPPGCNLKPGAPSAGINNPLFTGSGSVCGAPSLYLSPDSRRSPRLRSGHVTCPVLPSQPDLQPAMDYANNASNSYGSGDAVSAAVANMSIHEQRHQENGVQMGHRSPGDAKMKGQGSCDVASGPRRRGGGDVTGTAALVSWWLCQRFSLSQP